MKLTLQRPLSAPRTLTGVAEARPQAQAATSATTPLVAPTSATTNASVVRDAAVALYGVSDQSAVPALDAATQGFLLHSPIGRAAHVALLPTFMQGAWTETDERVAIDAVCRVLPLLVRRGATEGLCRAQSNAKASIEATVLARAACEQLLRHSRLLQTPSAQPLRQRIEHAHLAMSSALLRETPRPADVALRPVLVALDAVCGTRLSGSGYGSAAGLTAAHAAAWLSQLPADAPLTLRTTLTLVALRHPTPPPPPRVLRPQQQLGGAFLELQHRSGAVLEVPLWTALFVVVADALMARGGDGTRLEPAAGRAIAWLHSLEPDEAGLKALVDVHLQAASEAWSTTEVNRRLGSVRQDIVARRLQRMFPPQHYVIAAECVLRDKDGREAIDAETLTSRRLDFVVVDVRHSRVVRSVEVTAGHTAAFFDAHARRDGSDDGGATKLAQLAKEDRLRATGANYVRIGELGLVQLPDACKTEVWRL